jgi:hypothetical protein
MTDVTEDRDQAGAELPAADEQLLRELTERARTGGPKLTWASMTQHRKPGAKNESDSRADLDYLHDVMAASERRRIRTKSAFGVRSDTNGKAKLTIAGDIGEIERSA